MKYEFSNERGVALIATVMIIFLLTTLGSAYMISAVTEKDMSLNQLTSTRALFAADAGLEVATQQMHNFAVAHLDSLIKTWPGSGPVIDDPEGFFPAEGFSHEWTDPEYTVTTTTSFVESTLTTLNQTYDFYFTVRSTGSVEEIGRRNVRAEGKLRVSASRGTFADFLIFSDQQLTADGSPIWFHTSGYFSGRVHTNTIFRYAYFPTFEDLVTSVDNMAWYYNEGNNVKLDADRNGDMDVPRFFGGVERGHDEVQLPQNAFSQLRSSIGGDPSQTSEPTNQEIREALGITTGVPTDPPPDGVYVPSDGNYLTGGVYVQGNLDDMQLSVDGQDNQVLFFKHENGQEVTVIIDRANNTTTVDDGGTPVIYQNIPTGTIYTRGETRSIGGPVRDGDTVPPALQRDAQLTIVSEGDMVISRDIAYEDYDDGENIMGLYSSGGDVRIGTAAPAELLLDMFIMVPADGRCFTVDNYRYRDYSGQVHLRGGVAQSRYGAFGTFTQSGSMTGFGRDFRYDARGYVPPYWPGTTLFVTNTPNPQLLTWIEE